MCDDITFIAIATDDVVFFLCVVRKPNILNRLGIAHECDGRMDGHSDRQTDRTFVSNSAV